MAPTDTFIQSLAQTFQAGGEHMAFAFVVSVVVVTACPVMLGMAIERYDQRKAGEHQRKLFNVEGE